jgi:glutamate--cysteine ligase
MVSPIKKNSSALTLDQCRDYVASQLFSPLTPRLDLAGNSSPGSVGMELEALVLAPQGTKKNPQLVPLAKDGQSLLACMRELAARHHWQILEEIPGNKGEVYPAKIITPEQDYFTFEPGGQLEFSSRPYSCLDELAERFATVQKLLDDEFAVWGWEIVQLGINPWHSVQEIGLQLAKSRYQAMDQYFQRIGPYGQMMMRQTCSIQVALDFGSDETTQVERYLAAQLISPFAAALFANSPLFSTNGKEIACQRALIWQHLDPSRSGFPELGSIVAAPSIATCSASYAEFLLAAPVVFISALDYQLPEAPLAFSSWLSRGYKGIFPTLEDFITHTTLHFPEVRPRGFLELRAVDSQARIWQMVPAAFCLGLLYDAPQRRNVLDLLLPEHHRLEQWRHDAQFGLQKAALRNRAKQLMAWAQEGFERLPECFRTEEITKSLRTYARIFSERDTTPGQEMLAIVQRQHLAAPNWGTYQRLYEKWHNSHS